MEIWGYSTHIDIYQCDPYIIRSQADIIRYVNELCLLIEMKKFGSCILQNFGNDERVQGYTFIQMIETSLISGHLVECTDEGHIDIFSCKKYDSQVAHEFTAHHFRAQKSKFQVLER